MTKKETTASVRSDGMLREGSSSGIALCTGENRNPVEVTLIGLEMRKRNMEYGENGMWRW